MLEDKVRTSRRPRRLGFWALLLVPLLLVLNAPVLAAVVPGTLLAVASLQQAMEDDRRAALPAADVVESHDLRALDRIARATPIMAQSRRVS